jgi:hypothetical protein
MFGGVYTTAMNNFDQLSWGLPITDAYRMKLAQDMEEAKKTEQPVHSN